MNIKIEIAETETEEQAIRRKLTEIYEYFSKLQPGEPFNPFLLKMGRMLEDWLYINEMICEELPDIKQLHVADYMDGNDKAKMQEGPEKKYTIQQLRKAWGAGKYAAGNEK